MINKQPESTEHIDFDTMMNEQVTEVSRGSWTDPAMYDLEQKRIFTKTWIFLGHETEIPNPGDYVTRYMGEDPVILVRSEGGQVRAFHNSCSHRGTPVCRADLGNASHFRCPYHGWTYKNSGELNGIPLGADIYGKSLKMKEWGLLPVTRLESYAGLVFGNWDPEAPSLDEFLGESKWHMDLLFKRTPQGTEVVGTPQRWLMQANWKGAADNFAGDAYHTLYLHRSMTELGMTPPDPRFGMYGHQVVADDGAGLGFGMLTFLPGAPKPPYFALPEEMDPHFRQALSPDQYEELRNLLTFHGSVFPNFSWLNVTLADTRDKPPASFLRIATWVPKGPHQMEVWTWLLVEKEAPQWWRERTKDVYLHTFGSSGMFEQDDSEIWSMITETNRGTIGRQRHFNFYLGVDTPLDKDYKGPGQAYSHGYVEAGHRKFYRLWKQYMKGEGLKG